MTTKELKSSRLSLTSSDTHTQCVVSRASPPMQRVGGGWPTRLHNMDTHLTSLDSLSSPIKWFEVWACTLSQAAQCHSISSQENGVWKWVKLAFKNSYSLTNFRVSFYSGCTWIWIQNGAEKMTNCLKLLTNILRAKVSICDYMYIIVWWMALNVHNP